MNNDVYWDLNTDEYWKRMGRNKAMLEGYKLIWSMGARHRDTTWGKTGLGDSSNRKQEDREPTRNRTTPISTP